MLLTPIASPIAGQASGTLEAGGTGSELSGINPALVPTQHLPLVPPGARPTSILATNTPVIASIGATPTPVPTQLAVLPTATATATIPPTAIPTEIPAPVSFQAVGYNFVKQTWNTCGPANLTQVLNYMGWSGTKDQVISYLKPSTEDRNVSPWEMVNYVNEYLNKERGIPLRALMRVGGNLNLVKRLVANKFGVILEKGYFVAGEGWMGHYLTIEGYDDTTGTFNVLDTYLGRRAEKYQDVDSRWQQFNRIFIVIYSQEREAELARLMGGHQDVAYAINYALSKAKEEASTQPDNPYAWFNLGSNFTLLRDYQNAVRAFDKALNVGAGLPWRMLWYQFTMYEAYYNAGQYQQLKSLTEVTLGTSPDLEESHYWRGMALAALGETEAAQNAFRRHSVSIRASRQPRIALRNYETAHSARRCSPYQGGGGA